MAIKSTPFSSDMPVPPGGILKDEIDFLGITQKELADRMGRPIQAINEIINGKKAVTPETALELERVIGIKAQVWVNLESGYRLTLARNQERVNLESETALLKDFKVNELEKRGWIESVRKRTDKVVALRKFLGIASLDDYQRVNAAAYRITGGENYSPETLAVWLRKGELDAQKIETGLYDRASFESAVCRIRTLTSDAPQAFVPKMKRFCADAGVALVLTRELPKSGANGVARWLPDDKPLIQLSLKWKWADIFWFTFFHEAGHILNHKRDFYIEYTKSLGRKSPVEREADQFAADTLIRPTDWQRFRERMLWSAESVAKFAKDVRIHPGIVAGRLEHEKLVQHGRLNATKTKYVWTEGNG